MIATHRLERRRFDWIQYVLLLTAVYCLPEIIRVTEWVPEAERLVWVAFWASLVGILLARSPLPTWLCWLVGISLGVEYAVQFAGKLLPNLTMLARDTGDFFRWVWNLIARQSLGTEYPFARSIGHLIEQSQTMVVNLSEWYSTVMDGGSSEDVVALWLGVAFLVWLFCWNAGFELFRKRRTFVALLPLGLIVVMNACFTYVGFTIVQVFLAITLLTLVWANTRRMENIWASLGLDFSPELRRDTVFAGTIIAIIIFVLALITPYVTYNRAVFFFWDLIKGTVTPFYEDLDRAFAGRNPVPEPTKGIEGLGGHTIAEGVLGEDVLFYVQTSDPAPPPEEELEYIDALGDYFVTKRYWRERTYDVYTGSGWDTSARDTVDLANARPWTEISYPHKVLTQTYTFAKRGASLGLAVNEPYQVDRAYRAIQRQDGDLAALSFETPMEEYTVISYVPAVTVQELRAAEDPYPADVADRYLALPDIPRRIKDTAEQIVRDAGAATRYEKARAIETYIRMLDYDLDLEPPPLDADFVDYFLFDAQRGYCDYSASALVVMLRTVGVAARYASGYGMGEFDYGMMAWVVRESNAHAWVEVYFPGYGWIEFEPTPTQAVFTFVDAPDMGDLPQVTPQAEDQGFVMPLWGWGALVLATVVFMVVWPPKYFKRAPRDGRTVAKQVYGKLVSRGRWLGVYPRGGQTVREYLVRLVDNLMRRGDDSDGLSRDISLIGDIYQLAAYSDREISCQDGDRALSAWRRIAPKMVGFILTRSPDGRRQS